MNAFSQSVTCLFIFSRYLLKNKHFNVAETQKNILFLFYGVSLPTSRWERLSVISDMCIFNTFSVGSAVCQSWKSLGISGYPGFGVRSDFDFQVCHLESKSFCLSELQFPYLQNEAK